MERWTHDDPPRRTVRERTPLPSLEGIETTAGIIGPDGVVRPYSDQEGERYTGEECRETPCPPYQSDDEMFTPRRENTGPQEVEQMEREEVSHRAEVREAQGFVEPGELPRTPSRRPRSVSSMSTSTTARNRPSKKPRDTVDQPAEGVSSSDTTLTESLEKIALREVVAELAVDVTRTTQAIERAVNLTHVNLTTHVREVEERMDVKIERVLDANTRQVEMVAIAVE